MATILGIGSSDFWPAPTTVTEYMGEVPNHLRDGKVAACYHPGQPMLGRDVLRYPRGQMTLRSTIVSALSVVVVMICVYVFSVARQSADILVVQATS